MRLPAWLCLLAFLPCIAEAGQVRWRDSVAIHELGSTEPPTLALLQTASLILPELFERDRSFADTSCCYDIAVLALDGADDENCRDIQAANIDACGRQHRGKVLFVDSIGYCGREDDFWNCLYEDPTDPAVPRAAFYSRGICPGAKCAQWAQGMNDPFYLASALAQGVAWAIRRLPVLHPLLCPTTGFPPGEIICLAHCTALRQDPAAELVGVECPCSPDPPDPDESKLVPRQCACDRKTCNAGRCDGPLCTDTDSDEFCDDGDGDGSIVYGDTTCPSLAACDSGCDDNCWETSNPSQIDIDGDGKGRSCDRFELHVVDPVVSLTGANPLVSGSTILNDPTELALGGKPINLVGLSVGPDVDGGGVAADGVTKVFVRAFTPGPGDVTFQVIDPSGLLGGAVGTFESLTGSPSPGTTLTVPTNQVDVGADTFFVALAVFQAPADLPQAVTEKAPVNVRIGGFAQTQGPPPDSPPPLTTIVNLWRPPVVLMHGMWSDPSTWDLSAGLASLSNRYFLGDYEPADDELAAYREEPRQAIEAARGLLRGPPHNVAVATADYVAHSMGGLLGHRYASNVDGDYLRSDNFNSGDIHKLITLTTPHSGAGIANCLEQYFSSARGPAARTGRGLLRAAGADPTRGAIRDLRRQSPPIRSLQPAPVPSWVLTASGGDAWWALHSPLELDADDRPFRIVLWLANWQGFGPDVVYANELDDLIVGMASQQGGLKFGSCQNQASVPCNDANDCLPVGGPCNNPNDFGPGTGPDELGIHVSSVTRDPRIAARILELLSAPKTTFQLRPAPPSLPIPFCPVAGPALPPPPIVVTAAAQAAPGSAFQVDVDPGAFPAAQVIVSWLHDVVILEAPPWSAQLTMPIDAVGPYGVVAAAVSAAGESTSETMIIVSADTPIQLESLVLDASLTLTADRPRKSIVVKGAFSDGIVRPLPGVARATTFSSNDPSVATVDEGGVVTAVAIGSTTITVTNGLVSQGIAVEVEELPADTDGDGVPDFQDNCPDAHNPGQEDFNHNTIGDACEDFDGDGLLDADDNCPGNQNPGQEDSDSIGGPDGVGDACDICIRHHNPRVTDFSIDPSFPNGWMTLTGGQRDGDGDGIGNRCDADFDGIGAVVGVPDFNLHNETFNASREGRNCPPDDPSVNLNCDMMDMDGAGALISGTDLGLDNDFFGMNPRDESCVSSGCVLPCEGPCCGPPAADCPKTDDNFTQP